MTKNHISRFLLVLLLISCLPGCACFVVANIEKQNGSSQSNSGECNTFTCVREVDSVLQNKLRSEGKRMLQIYLIRHAKPDVNKKNKKFYSAKEAQQYVNDYNSAPIVPFDLSLVSVELNPGHAIYCSNLPRSQETALVIFGEQFPVVSDSIFREFEIRMINVNSLIKLPLRIWQAFSRGSWMLGFNHRGIESHKEAKLRAARATENLIKVAEQEETAVLVAHGMLNKAIVSELKQKGWESVQQKGHINLGATILVKIVDIDEQ